MKKRKWVLIPVALLAVVVAVSLAIAYRNSVGPSETPEGVVQIGPTAGGVFEDREAVWISSVPPKHLAGMNLAEMSWYALSGYRIKGNQVTVDVNEAKMWNDPSPYDFIYRLEYKPSADTVYVYQMSRQKDTPERLVAVAEECSATYYGNCHVEIFNSRGEVTDLVFGMFGDEIHFGSMVPYAYVARPSHEVLAHTDMCASDANATYELRSQDRVRFEPAIPPETDTWAIDVSYRSEGPFTINETVARQDKSGIYMLDTIWDKSTTRPFDVVNNAEGTVHFYYSTGGGEALTIRISLNPPE